MDVADTPANAAAFGRPGASRGKSAYPQIRFVSLLENGTHVLFGTRLGRYGTGEITLAKDVVANLEAGMLCLADRNFLGFELWERGRARKADLLWRGKKSLVLPGDERLADGSYLSRIYPSLRDRRSDTGAVVVRVIEYELEGVSGAEPLSRLITTILDPGQAPARELAALYHERGEIETALDELKTHLRGSRIVLRSKTPELVKQEFHGLMMAHFAIRGLMHEAALKGDIDPDGLSLFTRCESSGANCLTPPFPPRQKKAFHEAVRDEILEERVVSSRGRRNPRGVKRKMSHYPIRPRDKPAPHRIDIDQCIKVLK